LALRTLSNLKEKGKYTEFFLPNFVSRVCLGELEQYSNNGNLNISTLRYLKIIRGKTAALFEGAFLAGAIFSGEDEKYQSQYANLGRYVGMIFQLTDDCIDFEASEVEAKKPVGRDYEEGVITLPLIYAIKQNEEFDKNIKTGKLNIKEIIKLVIKFDGIGFTKGISKGYYKKASIIIDALEINIEKKGKLVDILEKSYNGITK
jgi:heptaprenyl diphosphate synthase